MRPLPFTLYHDGKEVNWNAGQTDAPAVIQYNDTLYVPLNLVGQNLHKTVGWDQRKQMAWIGDKPGAEPAAQAAAVTRSTNLVQKSAAMTKKADQSASPALFGLTLGTSAQQVTAILGQPVRKEPSAFGYEWWIYNKNPDRYVQVGILNGKVVDLYSNAPAAQIGSIRVGTSYQTLSSQYKLASNVSFTYEGTQIQITNQPTERPLVLQENTPVIFYVDKENHNLVTAIRMIDKLMLLRGGFYETRWSYYGKAPNFDAPPLSIKQQELVNAANERQSLDLVNVIRYRHKLPQLAWNEQVAEVARGHSTDMRTHNFFQHISVTTGLDPFDRLKKAGLSYQLAGENIAAGFPDAIEAFESWMNSPGHRKNILEKDFRQLGVGVLVEYYTQNFVTLQ